MRLHTVRIKIDAGEPEQVAISSLRPPLFFKYIPGFKQQLQLWNERKLSATLSAPYIITRYRQLKTRKEQRERNMRAKIRKEVDLYLNELRND